MQINQYPSIGSSSLSSLISSALARRQSSTLGTTGALSSISSSYTPSYSSGGGINYQSSAAISSITAQIDSLNKQVSEIKSKLLVSNSIKNSYSSSITSLNDFLESIKQDESKNLSGITNSNSNVTNVDVINSSANSQTINVNVKQVATATIVRSDILTGGNIDENTKITDLFAGKLDGYSLTSQRKDLNETKTMKELGIKTGSFTIGNKEISISDSETLGSVMQKIKDAGYDAEITADGALEITGTADKQISFSNQGTNFASALGLTVSEGDFSINGKSFSITSETTIKSLMNEINSSRDAGVGAMLQNGKLTLVSNLTGAVLIDIKKGSSNFTNAIGFTSGGEMIADNVVMGADGTATTLKGINSVSTDYADFTEGTFIISAGRNGNMVSEIINITSGDTVQDVIDKIAATGIDIVASVDKNGNFVLEQKNKGSDYQISVEAGSSNFTEKMGLTNGVENIGITNSGQNTGYYSTITGTNKVTLDTEVSAGSFKVNDTTIEISAGTIETALAEINAALSDKDVEAVFEDEKIVFKNKIMGNISLSVEGGTSNFGEIAGLTEASEGVSSVVIGQVGGKSTLTGSEDVSADTMITDGTVKINGFLIDLSAGTLESVVESLNEHSEDTKVTASIVDNRLVLTATENGANSISVEAGISNFVQVTGIAGYQTTAGTEEQFGSSKSAMTMANEVTYDTQILESVININGTEITVSGTIANAIAAINAQTGTTGVEAFLNTSNRFVLRNVNDGSSGMNFSTSSDFGRVVGAGTYVVTGGSNTKLDQTNATVTGSVTGLGDGTKSTMDTQLINGSILTIGNTSIELGTSIASAIRAINAKTAETGVEASLDEDGRFVLKAVDTSVTNISFSLSGNGDFGRVTGLGSYTIGASDSGTGVVGARQTTLTGSCDVIGDMKISNSTISILAHNQVQTFELSGTLDDVIKTLSESEWTGHNGITASIENGKFVIRLNDEGAKELTVNVISGDFGRVTGMADYLMGGATVIPGTTTVVGGGGSSSGGTGSGQIQTSDKGTVIVSGGNDVAGTDYILNGTLKIGSEVFNTKNTTLQEVIDRINSAGIDGVSAYIENDRFVIKSVNVENVISATGDFARVTGIASYTVGAAESTGNTESGGSVVESDPVGMQNVSQITKADALSKGYIVIETANDLINAIASDGQGTAGKTFILMNDIDMSTVSGYVSKSNFAGTFDGNGYTITNLSAENGIFASTTETSTIKNVQLSNFNIVSVGDNVGALAGKNSGVILNSGIDANSLVTGNSYVGALVGGGTGKLENVTSRAEVRATGQYAGGLAGSSGDILNSEAYGKVTGNSSYVGGLSGVVTGNIENSLVEAVISGGDYTGGLAGQVTGKISQSHTKGSVSGKQYTGGLVGNISSSIKDSYSWSDVTAAGNFAGGLVGATSGNVLNSYSKGNVTSSGYRVGGLIGSINGNITIDKTYALGNVSGTSNVGGLIGSTDGKRTFTLSNSYAKGNVSVTQAGIGGGLAGTSNGGSIMNTYATGNVTITGSYSGADREATAGGLIGNAVDTSITRSFATGAVNNSGASKNGTRLASFAGGLVGTGENLRIETSYATGAVTLSLGDNTSLNSVSAKLSAGGLVASLSGSSTIEKSWASNTVLFNGTDSTLSAENFTGGLVGRVDLTGAVTINNSYASGTVKINSADDNSKSFMGGLVGGAAGGDAAADYLTIKNSFASAQLLDSTSVYMKKTGGIFGYSQNSDTVLIENSFFDMEKAGLDNATGSSLGEFNTGLTTSQINNKIDDLKQKISSSTANSYSPESKGELLVKVDRITKQEAEEKGYIVIESAADFLSKVGSNATAGKTFILMNDLDFSEISVSASNNSYIAAFKGVFDGNGYTIKGVKGALFDNISGDSTIKNLGIDTNISISHQQNLGVIANNTASGSININNVFVIGRIYVNTSDDFGRNFSIGGLIGEVGSSSTLHVLSSFVNATIDTYCQYRKQYTGGLIGGTNSSTVHIHNSFVKGKVESYDYAGGLIGYKNGGSAYITHSFSEASVSTNSSGNNAGGLVGYNTSSLYIENAYAIGKVSGHFRGSILGFGDITSASNTWYDGNATGVANVSGSHTNSVSGITNQSKNNIVYDRYTAGKYTSNSDTSNVNQDILNNKIFSESEAQAAGFVLIHNAAELKNFLSGTSSKDQTFILMDDIDLTGVTGLTSMKDFAGTFYGNGHSIRNFSSSSAMFDSVTATGSIRNLKIMNADVSGSDNAAVLVNNLNGGVIDNVQVSGSVLTTGTGKYAGGLVAYGNGHIDNSSFEGIVTGKNSSTGGLVGYSDATGIAILNSYTTGSVIAAQGSITGGLVGSAESIVKINNSLSSASVTGTTAGGLIGSAKPDYTEINNSSYKKQSGVQSNGIVDERYFLKDNSSYEALSTEEAGKSETFTSIGWDSSVWSFTKDGPKIKDTDGMTEFNVNSAGSVQVADAIGTSPVDSISKEEAIAKGYIVIETASDLANIIAADGAGTLGKTYILMGDIDMSKITGYVSKANFAGTFDGNGYSIKNLSAQNGLFASATATSTIKNVKLVHANIGSSADNVGGLVGTGAGTIENSSIDSTSIIGGNSYVGGLVGGGSSTIINSSSDAEVRANVGYGGGLAGSSGDIINSMAAGIVTSFGDYVGGLAASVNGNISNSTVSANVSGLSYAGGLAAVITGDISNSSVTGTISGDDYIGGLAGKITGDIEDSSANVTLDGANYLGGLTGELTGNVTNSCSQGTITATGINIGGLVGRLSSTNHMTIKASYSEMAVKGSNAVGGLIGGTVTGSAADIQTSFTVIDSYAKGNVEATGGGTAGGLIGYAYGGTILNSYAKGNVTVTGQNSTATYQYNPSSTNSNGAYENAAGGLIGLAMNGEVRNSFATGNVVNKGYKINGKNVRSSTGGLIGSGSYNIFNSYASGNVTYASTSPSVVDKNEENFVGGLVGRYYGGNIEQAWSTGNVIASNYQKNGTVSTTNYIGGLVGEARMNKGLNIVIKDSWSKSAVTMQQYNARGTTYIGGLVGEASFDSAGVTLTIKNSFASAAIRDTQSESSLYSVKSGGLLGYSGQNDSVKIEKSFFNYEAAGIENAFGSLNATDAYALDSVHIDSKISSLKETIAAGDTIEETKPSLNNGFVTQVDRISEEEAIARGYVVIKTAQDFVNLIAQNGSGTKGKTYILMNDIDMSGISNYVGKENFEGTFDGNGYKIKNLYYYNETCSSSSYGVFNNIKNGAVIKNVGIENVNIDSVTYDNTGGLVGYMAAGSSVINSYTTGRVDGWYYTGGLVGYMEGNTIIKDSYSIADVNKGVNTGYYVGGLVGYAFGNNSQRITIENSFATGSVYGDYEIGGLIGSANYVDITDSYSNNIGVYATSTYSGGFIGSIISNTIIKNSYSTSYVTGGDSVGGFIGLINGENNKIYDSYFDGQVEADYITGGFVGTVNSNQNYLYNIHVSGSLQSFRNDVGGLIGHYNANNLYIYNAYVDADIVNDGGNSRGIVYVTAGADLYIHGFWFDASKFIKDSAGDYIVGQYAAVKSPSYMNNAKIKNNERISESEATSAGYVLIKTVQDLKNLLSTNGDDTLDKTYVLMNDIDLSGVRDLTAMSGFKGTLYGNGYTIKNFSSQSGLFDSIDSGGSVRNLNFENSAIGASKTAGTVVNHLNGGTIDHVTVNGGSVALTNVSGQSAGGLVGYGFGTISYSGFNGSISGKDKNNGGLIGYTEDDRVMNIYNSYVTGNVLGSSGSTSGGLVGMVNGSKGILNIKDSYSSAAVSGSSSTGGLVGNAGKTENVFIAGSSYQKSYEISAIGSVDDFAFLIDGSSYESFSNADFRDASVFEEAGWSSDVWQFDGETPILSSSSLLTEFSTAELNNKSATLQGSVVVGSNPQDVKAFKGQKDGTLSIMVDGVGTFDISISANDTLKNVLDKISGVDGKLSAKIDTDGKILISYNGVTPGISVEDTSGFAEFYGLNASSKTWDENYSVGGTVLDPETIKNFETITVTGGYEIDESDISLGGTIQIGSGAAIDTTNKTIGEIIELINESAPFGVTAGIDEKTNKFYISSKSGSQDITVNGDFARITGLASYVSGTATAVTVEETYTKMQGSTGGLSGDELVLGGTIKVGSGAEIDTTNKTLNEIVAAINAQNQSGVTAHIEDGKFTIHSVNGKVDITVSGDFARVTGMADYSVSNAQLSSSDPTIGGGTTVGFVEEVDRLTEEEAVSQGYMIITSAEQLANIKQNLAGKYILMCDIDLSDYGTWTALGNFTGELNGNGYVIKGLTDTRKADNAGLFTIVTDGVIKNLGFEDIKIIANSSGGAISGSLNGTTIVSNCYATGTVSSGMKASGLSGAARGDVTIENSYAKVNITGTGQDAGGLIGLMAGQNLTISNSFYSGTINGTNSVGGLVGSVTSGILNVDSSYVANSTIKGKANSIGGLVGLISSAQEHSISNSSFDGTISGTENIGGLIGINNNGIFSITNSHVSGQIGTTSSKYVGGFIGLNGNNSRRLSVEISNSYSTADITGKDNLGGFVGRANTSDFTIEKSFVSGSISSSSTGVGGFAGYGQTAKFNIYNSYSIASVKGGSYVGGLVGCCGERLIVENSYAAGLVTSTGSGGAIAGYNDNYQMKNVFWDTEKTNKFTAIGTKSENIAGTTGLSSSAFADQSNFTGWSSTIWDFSGDAPKLIGVGSSGEKSAGITGSVVTTNLADKAFSGQKTGTLLFSDGTSVSILDTDSRTDVIEKIKEKGLNASIDGNGKITISKTGITSLTVSSDSSGFAEFYGLNTTGKTWNGSVSEEEAYSDFSSKLISSSSADISNSAFVDQKTGSFKINVNGGTSYTVNVSENDSLRTVLDKINALDTNFEATVNSDGKVEIKLNGTIAGISVSDDTSNFTYAYGLASDVKEYAADKNTILSDPVGNTEDDPDRFYQVIGANDVALYDYVVHGSIQIENGAVIDISGNTIEEIIDKINAQKQPGITALIENGKFVIKYTGSEAAPSFTATGDFARVTGLSSYTVGQAVYSSVPDTSSTVTGSVSFDSGLDTQAFKGQKDGTMTIAVTGVGLIKVENITASDSVRVVLDKIKAADSNLSAYINSDGKIVISYNGTGNGIAIGDDSTGFSAFYGLRSTETIYKGEAEHQAPDPIITHTSSSSLYSANDDLTADTVFTGQTSSSFDIYLGEDFVKSVVVESTDTVQDVIDKINGGNLKARLVDGRIQISTVNGTTLSLSVVSFSGNWATLAGLNSGDTVIQADPTKVLGAMNDLTYTGGTVQGLTGSHVIAGLKDGTFRIYMNNTSGKIPTIRVNATDSVDDILDKMKEAVAAVGGTLNASVQNGKIILSTSADFATSISFGEDTSGFLELAGLTSTGKTYDANYTSTDAVLGTDMFLGSVSGITENHVFGDLTAGTMTVSSGSDSVTVNITETSSVKDIIDQIQATGAFKAGLVDGKFFIQKTASTDSEITVTSTSNFAQLAGLEAGVFTGSTTTSSGGGSQSQITGSVAGLDGSKKFSYTKEGYFTISVGGENAVNIEVTAETTIQDVIDAINDTGSYTAKLDDEGRLVIATASSADASIKISNGTTNFAKIVGLNAGYISSNAESTKGDLDIASSLTGSVNNLLASNKFAAGDFKIIVEAPDGTIKEESFDLTGKETLYTILNRISDSSLGITAEYKNGGVVLTVNETGAFKISVVDGTSDFAEKTGFTTNGTQSVNTVLGSQPDVTSANTTYSVSVNGFSAGNFYISLTDLDGNIVKTTQINVLATDTVDSLISKINNSGAGVNAYINNKDQLVLAMNSDMDANSIVIQKGTSDFTNKIGFTQGGDVSDDAIYLIGDPVGNTTVSSNVLAYTTSTSLASLGITEGNFVLNGKTIQVIQDIQTLIDNINAAFSPNEENGVRASFENGRIVLTATVASSESVINIEAGSSNFTEFAGLTTNKVMNTTAQTAGQNAQFEINGNSFEQESNTVYIDKDGNVTQDISDAALRLTLKATGITLITIDKSQLSAPIDKLQTFVNKFNQTMSYANNSQLAGDAGLTAILNKIKSALTADIDGQSGTIDRLSEIGINVYEDANGTKIYLEEDKFSEQYLNNPDKVTDVLIGDDSKPLNYYKAGSFTRLSDTMSNTKNYFSSMTSSLTNQKKSIEKEITLKKSELRDLERQLASSGSGSGDGGISSDLAAYIAALDEKLNLLTELIMKMQKSGGSGSGNSVAYILNRNNPSFGLFF